MPTFTERVRELHHAGADPATIATTLLQHYTNHPDDLPELHPVLRHQISSILSRERHTAEDKAFRRGDPTVVKTPRSAHATARVNTKAAVQAWRQPNIAQWLATRVHLPTGETLTWGQLSATQHAERAAALQQHIAGRMETIRRHHVSQQLIEDNKVSCLNDLDLDIAR